MAAIARVRGGPRGHRRALREADEHEPLEGVRRGDRGDDGVHVGDVVGDGQLAILVRHPVRDDLLRGAVVEAVQPLHRHEEPGLGARQRRELVEQVLGALPVAVEADHGDARGRGQGAEPGSGRGW